MAENRIIVAVRKATVKGITTLRLPYAVVKEDGKEDRPLYLSISFTTDNPTIADDLRVLAGLRQTVQGESVPLLIAIKQQLPRPGAASSAIVKGVARTGPCDEYAVIFAHFGGHDVHSLDIPAERLADILARLEIVVPSVKVCKGDKVSV